MNNLIENYIILAHKIDNSIKETYDLPYIDAYIGDKTIVEGISYNDSPKELLKETLRLYDSLQEQDFQERRVQFLIRQLKSMETVTRKLCGENFSFDEEAQNCLDTTLELVPEENFKYSLELYNEALPGKGSLKDRYSIWYERNNISKLSKEKFKEVIMTIIKEISVRTDKLFDMPDIGKINLEIVEDRMWGAANWYLGNYTSHMQINKSVNYNLFTLLPLLCHEGYPGHHTEYSFKEDYLVNKKNYQESSLFIINSPQAIIFEGIAENAFEMIFTPDEAGQWMKENLYKGLGIKCDDVNISKLYEAQSISGNDQVNGNAIYMLNNGYSEKEVVEYIMKYTFLEEEKAQRMINYFKQSTLWQIYNLSYSNGKRIIKNLVAKDKSVFREILMEQTYPSLLEKLYLKGK